MKLIRSFFVALLIFAVFAGSIHFFFAEGSLKSDNPKFGLWYNTYKNTSYNALSQNIEDDTMLVFGSSEFRHGLKSKYHPINLFSNRNINLMSVGAPYTQCLFHTIALGSLEPDVKLRKVVLLVSPTWFKPNSLTPANYTMRFSETQYIAFMENPNISPEIKKFVAEESERLTKSSGEINEKIKIVGDYNLDSHSNNTGLATKAKYAFIKAWANEKDKVTVTASLKAAELGFDSSLKAKPQQKSPDDKDGNGAKVGNSNQPENGDQHFQWDKLCNNAYKASSKQSKNVFFMSNYSWKKDFAHNYKLRKNFFKNVSFSDSDEYRYLEEFLKLCNSRNIKCKLIILPVNGRWYDYAGFSADKRKGVDRKVSEIGFKYGADVASLSKYNYRKYFTKDAVHPWNEGWLRINEEIFNFYNKE